jgi:DNA mismatch repair protein MutS
MYKNRNIQPNDISLLWCNAQDSLSINTSDAQAVDDLRVNILATTISQHSNYNPFIYKTLLTLITDSATLEYRHAILEDCLAHDKFTAGLALVLSQIRELHQFTNDIRTRRNEISITLSRLTELENYVDCVQALHALLNEFKPQLKADGWLNLHQKVDTIVTDPQFSQMVEELPQLRGNIREIVSITIGVNLSRDLRPNGITLLSLNKERFKGPRFFRKLWGIDEEEDIRGLTRLREAPVPQQQSIMADRSKTLDLLASNALFSDLGKVLDDVIRPIAQALQTYTRVNSGFLRYIEPEIAFFIGAVKLIQRLRQQGLPMTKPTILPMADRQLEATNLYNLDLALRLSSEHPNEDLNPYIVGNDVCFDDSGRIQILTGPNRGGKTTYTQSIGLLHILAQSGLYIPAESASLSPIDVIFLHFPVEENPTMESGRLGEEAQRLRTIFKLATPHSLILLNESLASTSASESYYLARDIVSCLRILGTRAVFVTHLHELAEDSDAINAEVAGDSAVQSVVSMVDQSEDGVTRTYKVIPAPPRGRSYAREIAQQYGISFEQLQSLLNDRDILNGK